MSAVNAYLLATRLPERFWLAPRIHCADGYSLSVQVNAGSYCSPRDGVGPDWASAEIGYPSERPTDAVMEYAEDPDYPTNTVYGYVPMALIDELVDLHGGIANMPASEDQPPSRPSDAAIARAFEIEAAGTWPRDALRFIDQITERARAIDAEAKDVAGETGAVVAALKRRFSEIEDCIAANRTTAPQVFTWMRTAALAAIASAPTAVEGQG